MAKDAHSVPDSEAVAPVADAPDAPDAPAEDAVDAPDAPARDMALVMLLERHGGSIRVNPTTVDRVTKSGRAIRVAQDATTGETYVTLG